MEISEQALSRMMADAVARISRDAQGPSVSRMEATVVSVASDGSMTLNRGTPERPQMLYGVRSLTSAAGAASGDIAVVETFDHVSYVIGIVAKALSEVELWYGRATGGVTLSESADNFSTLGVHYAYGVCSLCLALDAPSSVGASVKAPLSMTYASGDVLWIKTRNVVISGTSVTAGSAANFAVNSDGTWVQRNFPTTPEILITRVVGYR